MAGCLGRLGSLEEPRAATRVDWRPHISQYGALERTGQEFHDLLKSGGFEMTEVVPTRSPLSIIVAQPMPTEQL